MEKHIIREACESFSRDLDAIHGSVPFTIVMLQIVRKATAEARQKFLEQKCTTIEHEDQKTFNIPRERHEEFRRLDVNRISGAVASDLIPRTFLVSLISQFDVFIGRLLSAAFTLRPELLNASDRKISFSEISDFNSIEEIKKSIIDTEIDSFLRKSITEQFDTLETKLGIPLRQDFEIWPELVEITQRRNLFVHSDGIVSKQYMNVCETAGCNLSGIVLGQKLAIDSSYFRRAHSVLSEAGIKLAQVIWRKLDPATTEEADTYLNVHSFDLLKGNRCKLSRRLLDFAFTKPMKHPNKQTELMLLVNRANANKLLGDEAKCKELIEAQDWSAYDLQFRLARAVLLDKHDEVFKLMEEIGDDSHPSKHEYREWPLFKGISKHPGFADAFKKVFSEDLIPEEAVKSVQGEAAVAALMSVPQMDFSELMKETAAWIHAE